MLWLAIHKKNAKRGKITRMERENTDRYMNVSVYTTPYKSKVASIKKVVLGCVIIPSKSVVNIL